MTKWRQPCDAWREHLRDLRRFRETVVGFNREQEGIHPLGTAPVDEAIAWAEQRLALCEKYAEPFMREVAAILDGEEEQQP